MTFKELSAKLANSVQTVPNLINVLSDAFSNMEGGGSGGGGGADYSTTEVDTGIKWTDGKPIYMRTFTNVGIPQNSYNVSLDLGVEVDTIVKIEANNEATVNVGVNIIFAGIYAKINKTAGSNTILNPTNQLANLTGATLTVYYTKTA